ncbi:MAG: tetratricopeptide repeat protein [Beijerinckiaceae bacterium]
MTGSNSIRHSFRASVIAAALALSGLSGFAQAREPADGARAGQGGLGVAETAYGNFLAALAAENRKDAAAAAHFYREALRADPRNVELQERAFIAAVQDGSMPDAFRLAERVINRDSQNALAHLTLGVRALRNRQFQTARASFQRAGGRGRNADISAALLVGWTYVGSGELKKALEAIDRFNDPQMNAFRNFYAGLMADVAGDRREAGKRLKAAYDAEPGTIRLADAYARFEARHGSRDAAKAVYEKFAGNPAQAAFVALPKKQIDEGKTPDPLVLNVAQGAADVLYSAADLGGRPGTEMLSILYLQLANHLNPDNDIILATMGENFEQAKQLARAVTVYGRVQEESGLKSRVTMRAAAALDQLNRSEEAIKLLEERIAKAPDDLNLQDTISAIYRGKKRWPEAVDAASKAIALIPNPPEKKHWNLYYSRGMAYERSKQWPLAEADFQKALSLLPDEPRTEGDKAARAHVLNYLAYSWVDMGMNIDQSFAMLKRAVELQPRDGYIIDSLGWAYYKLGKYEDAVRELERAVDIRPQDPVLNDHLGDAYWKVGRTNEAMFQWNHARDLKPEPEELEKILKKIERGGLEEPKAADGDTKKPNGG